MWRHVTQRRDCKQLQNHTDISTCRRMKLTPFNAHRRSLSSVAVTAVHGLHLQDYTATNLRNRARSKCSFEAIMIIPSAVRASQRTQRSKSSQRMQQSKYKFAMYTYDDVTVFSRSRGSLVHVTSVTHTHTHTHTHTQN